MPEHSFSTSAHDIEALVDSARMYYVEGRTQAEIAQVLGVSRPTVSRLLAQARDAGVVQIRILDPRTVTSGLGQVVARATGVRRVVVVPGDADHGTRRERLGRAGAGVLGETVKSGDRVGIGWGRTLRAVGDALHPIRDLERVTCVPLLGGLGSIAPSFQVHDITSTIASALGGAALSLYLPAIVEDDLVRKQLLDSPDASLVMAEWAHLDVALVGIGNTDFDSEMQLLFSRYLDSASRTHATQAHVAGDICMRFFDRDGHPVPSLMRGVIGIELAQLRRVPRVIAVAGGVEKAEAVLGALRGGYVHTLVTDEPAISAIASLLGLVPADMGEAAR